MGYLYAQRQRDREIVTLELLQYYQDLCQSVIVYTSSCGGELKANSFFYCFLGLSKLAQIPLNATHFLDARLTHAHSVIWASGSYGAVTLWMAVRNKPP